MLNSRSSVDDANRRRQRLVLVSLFACLVTWTSACLSTGAAPEPKPSPTQEVSLSGTSGAQVWNATPPTFEVTGGKGAKLLLLGTIHLGYEEGWTFDAPLDEAIDDAGAIVMEIDLNGVDEEASSNALMRHGILPPTTPLSKLISPETARVLAENDELLTASGAPAQVREAMQPWVLMVLLVESMTRQSGLSSEQSVERKIMRVAGDRPLLGLETLDEQLGIFAGLPFEVQELILQDTLNRWHEGEEQIREMIQYWRENDQNGLMKLARQGAEETPGLHAFYDVLLDERNRNWVTRLVELLEDPSRADTSVLVAVGSLHLVGPNSVPDLLGKAGYTVSEPFASMKTPTDTP